MEKKLMREKHAGRNMLRKDVPRRIACILLAAAVLAVQLCIPGAPGTASARAAETSAVTTASAGNAAGGVKVTHSVSIPKAGDRTAEITIDLQSDLQVKKHTDTVFVFDCSAMANMEEQKSAVKEVAQKLLTDGATRFALVKYSNNAETALDFTNNYAAFAAAVDALSADANANAYAGLKTAKEMLDARGNAANEANIVIVSTQGCNFNASQAEALSGEIRDGGIRIYGLSAFYIGEMKKLCSELIAFGANGVGTQLAIRLCASPSYQNVSIEGLISEKFKQRGRISVSGKNNSEAYLSAFFEGAEAVYENNRYTIRIPEWYAGESVSLTLHADLCDRREVGVIPVTGELALKADNLAQVSAAALSISRTGFRVTYGTGSGTGSVPEDPAPYAEGSTVALKEKPADLKKDGQNFSGWGASGGVNIRDGSFTMPGSDVTLQALWGRAYIQKRTNTVTQEPTRRMRNRQAIGYTNAFYATAYRDHIQSITFLNTNEMPAGAVAVWDITDTNFGTAGSVMAAVVVNESDASKYDLYIGAKGGVEAPVSSYGLFSGFSSLTTIKDASNFDTLNVTNMSMMFANCKALTTLDLSGWDTSNVTNMKQTFYYCEVLTTLDLSGWDTSNVTDMGSMFERCLELKTLNVSGWNTGNVKNMREMFDCCSELVTLDVSRWNTSNVTSMYGTFYCCSELVTLDVSRWDTSSVTEMRYLFYDCSALKTLNISNWETGNVTDMGSLFSGCEALTMLGVSRWDTSNVTNMHGLFYECKALTTLDLSGWETGNVTDMSHVFYGCEVLTTPNISGWDTSGVTDMSNMFYNCRALTTPNISGWDTRNVTDMSHMFSNCAALTTPNISGWDTENVTTMSSLFYNCDALVTLDLSRWNTGNVKYMSDMFASCDRLVTLDLSGWDTRNVIVMGGMFYWCLKLETLDLSGWVTGNVTNMEEMFQNCRVLKELDLSGWDTSKLTNMESMFQGCLVPGIGTDQLTVANGCSITDWNKNAPAALTAVTIRTVDGTVLYPETAASSLCAADMSALRVDGKQTFMVFAEEKRETDSLAEEPSEEFMKKSTVAEEIWETRENAVTEEATAEEERSSSVYTAAGGNATLFSGAERDSEPVYASVKNGVTEGGKLTAGRRWSMSWSSSTSATRAAGAVNSL